jgi:hypothetical protein
MKVETGFGLAADWASRDSNKACVILLYFGALPDWTEVWKFTAQHNNEVTFFVFQDDYESCQSGNVFFVKAGLEAFNNRVSQLDNSLTCAHPYKICDFRPLLAQIVPDVIRHYDYWGWGDLDVFYGDLSETVAPGFGRYDYIATGWNGESGPLAFFRNTEAVNHLWRRIPDVREKLNSRESFALDEKDFLDLLRDNVDCDIEFRECLKDLPATWRDGKLTSRKSGRQYALHHFGGHVGGSQPQINKMSAKLLRHIRHGGGFVIKRNFKVARSHWWH